MEQLSILEPRELVDYGGQAEVNLRLPSWTQKVIQVALATFRFVGLLPSPERRLSAKRELALKLIFSGVLAKHKQTPSPDQEQQERLVDLEDENQKLKATTQQQASLTSSLKDQNETLESQNKQLQAQVSELQAKLEAQQEAKWALKGQLELASTTSEPKVEAVETRNGASQAERKLAADLDLVRGELEASNEERQQLFSENAKLRKEASRSNAALQRSEEKASYWQQNAGEWRQAYDDKNRQFHQAKRNERLSAPELQNLLTKCVQEHGTENYHVALNAFCKVAGHQGDAG